MDGYLERLRAANQRRHKEWAHGESVELSFRGVELAGEVGEVCNEIKKLERVRLNLAGAKTDLNGIREELADVLICADLIAMDLGIDLGPEIQKKFDKTSKKYDLKSMFDGEEEVQSFTPPPFEQAAHATEFNFDYEPLDMDEIAAESQRVDDKPKPSGGWKGQPATEKQIAFLKKMGYTGSEQISKSEASELIGVYKEKCGYE